MQDMVGKGRASVKRGPDSPRFKLTPEVRAAIAADGRPSRVIALELGVSKSLINNIRKEYT